jgi:transcriptional regulator with XRE-family HTH domain
MTKNIGQFILEKRKSLGITQAELAEIMKLSRQTLIQVEKGLRDLTITEAENVANVFGLSIDQLLKREADRDVPLEKEMKEMVDKIILRKSAMRISVPQKNLKIFKEVLLYILSKVGGKSNVGETVLYKLLYFIDFNYYEKFEKQLIGATYIKNHYGPTPVEFKKVVERMIKDGNLEKIKSTFFKYEQKKYLPLRKPNISMLSGEDMKVIDDVLANLSDKTASELSKYSHEDIPWKIAENGKPISYESVFYRSDPYSVRSYEPL